MNPQTIPWRKNFFSNILQADIFEKLSYVVLVYALLYSCLKATTASIYFDEVTTFKISQQSLFDILTYREASAANHLLNTLWMKLSYPLFGLSELMFRLPSLTGHLIYLVTMFKTLKLFTRKELLLCSYLLLTLNPLLLDMFSIARGYGLALGFLSLGLYFFLLAIRDTGSASNMTYFNRAGWLLALAVVSNLVFIYPYLSFIFLVLLVKTLQYRRLISDKASCFYVMKIWGKTMAGLFLSGLLLVLLYTRPLIRMSGRKDFNFWGAGKTGFWEDSVSSLIHGLLYDNAHTRGEIFFFLKGLVFLLFWGAVLSVLYRGLIKKALRQTDRYLFGIILWILLCTICVQLNWILFKIGFVVNRMAVFYYPLFFILVALLWQGLVSGKAKLYRAGVSGCFMILTVSQAINFIQNANLSLIHHVSYDASTKDIMKYLCRLHEKDQLKNQSLSLGTHWFYRHSMNFYREKYRLNWLKPVSARSLQDLFDRYDYYLLIDDKDCLDKESYRLQQEVIAAHRLKVIKSFQAFKSPRLLLAIPTK